MGLAAGGRRERGTAHFLPGRAGGGTAATASSFRKETTTTRMNAARSRLTSVAYTSLVIRPEK